MIQGNLVGHNLIYNGLRDTIMQHFQSILIAIGILAIAGVLIHGFLTNRKEQLAQKELEQEQYDEQHIDDDLEQESDDTELEADLNDIAFSESREKDDYDNFNFTFDEYEPVEHDVENGVENTTSVSEVKEGESLKPVEADVITEIPVKDFHMAEAIEKSNQPEITEEPAAEPEETNEVELFIFNVAAKGDNRLGGHELLQFFLTSGFRYGDMNIFHRHENSDGTGEVLFSIANMMAPGTFDLDTIEQFNSPGISFFFTAPNPKISVNEAFELMLRAVEQVAEEFDCDVLNEKREMFTSEQFHEYQDRLKKYN